MPDIKTKEEILSNYEYDVHYYGGGRRHILEAMDQYYNQAIDDAITVIMRISTPARTNIIHRIESLKKKP